MELEREHIEKILEKQAKLTRPASQITVKEKKAGTRSDSEEVSGCEYWDDTITNKHAKKEFKQIEKLNILKHWRDNTEDLPEDGAILNDATGVAFKGPVEMDKKDVGVI